MKLLIVDDQPGVTAMWKASAWAAKTQVMTARARVRP